MEFEFSAHALEQMERREISKTIIEKILQNPQQTISETGYTVYQTIIKFDDKDYLVRVFLNESVTPFKIITVYKTSKIDKYYEGEV